MLKLEGGVFSIPLNNDATAW